MNRISIKNIFFILVASAVLSLSFAQVNLQDAGYGDVEPDGKFNAADVARIKDHLMERIDLSVFYEGEAGYTDPAGHALNIADANRDGNLDLEDIAWLRKTYNDDSEITIYLDEDYPANNDIPMVFVRIPGGTFQMGSPEDERNRDPYEGPLHEVTLEYDFYLGKYEVTQRQWLAVRGSWPSTAPSGTYGLGDDYPAYYVSWVDAHNFITDLNQHIIDTNQGPLTVRLPGEAEWEYSARAGTQTRFYFGNSLTETTDMWIEGPTDSTVYPGNRTDYMRFGSLHGTGSRPVGGLEPNAFGLYDMAGNVYEWCEKDPDPESPAEQDDDSIGPADYPPATKPYLRGGSWGDYTMYQRAAYRLWNYASVHQPHFGFRLLAERE